MIHSGWPGYRAQLDAGGFRFGETESVIAAEGKLGGRRVTLIAFDFDFLGGAMGEASGRRITGPSCMHEPSASRSGRHPPGVGRQTVPMQRGHVLLPQKGGDAPRVLIVGVSTATGFDFNTHSDAPAVRAAFIFEYNAQSPVKSRWRKTAGAPTVARRLTRVPEPTLRSLTDDRVVRSRARWSRCGCVQALVLTFRFERLGLQ